MPCPNCGEENHRPIVLGSNIIKCLCCGYSWVKTDTKWQKVTIPKNCLCPVCHHHGIESEMRSPRGQFYQCDKCGLKLRAVEIYKEPIIPFSDVITKGSPQ